MFNSVLVVHSWLRWAVILTALVAAVRAIAGVSGKRPWTRADDRAGFWFLLTFDLQVVVGLLLYFVLSPITRAALQDLGGAMGSAGLRFWGVEHTFGMLVAVALAHAGRAKSRKATDSAARHRVAAICFGLALVAILVSIPWPGLPNARPLIRW